MTRQPRGRPLVVLMYHAVIREPLAVPNWCFLSEADFARQMEWLRSRRFDLVALGSLEQPRAGRWEPLVAVTFDDGFLNNFEYAYPILKKFDIPATVFLATEFVDSRRRLWFCEAHRAISMTRRTELRWEGVLHDLSTRQSRCEASHAIQQALKAYPHDELLVKVGELAAELDVPSDAAGDDDDAYQVMESRHVRAMRASGLMEFGSHTASHAILSRLSPERQRREIGDSIRGVQELTGEKCTLFAYPNGGARDYDAGVVALLSEAGIRKAFTAIEGRNEAAHPPLELRRFGIGDDPRFSFESLMAAAAPERASRGPASPPGKRSPVVAPPSAAAAVPGLRVLFVYRYASLGGVETSLLVRADALRRLGVHCEVFFMQAHGAGGPSLAAYAGVRVGVSVEGVRQAARRFDFVVVFDDPGVMQALETLDACPLVLFEHHNGIAQFFDRLHAAASSPLVAALVVPSRYNRIVLRRSGIVAAPVHVVPNAVDARAFAMRPHARSTAQAARAPLIAWVGRLENEKNIQGFVDLAEALSERRPHLRFVAIGDAPDYDSVVAAILAGRSESLRTALSFRRWVSREEMPEIYAQASASGGCLVITSRYESQPMIILEAMASGCPVVAPDVGGIKEILDDGVTGRLYPPGDLAAGRLAVEGLLDPGLTGERDRMVRAANARVRERHASHAIGQRYLAVLLATRRRAEHHASRGATGRRGGSPTKNLVSVILPVRNRPALLKTAVASVLRQTYRKWELIIVDDGSSDETPAVCDELARAHEKVSVLHARHTGRPGLAREQGRLRARGEFIQYLDSDDLLHPRKLEVMVAALVESGGDVAYCKTRRYAIGDFPVDTPSRRTGLQLPSMLPYLLSGPCWHTHTPLYRRTLCDAAGGWSDLALLDAWEYDARIASRNPKLVHCPQFLADAREHGAERVSSRCFAVRPAWLPDAVRAYESVFMQARAAGISDSSPEMAYFVDDVRALLCKCERLGLHAEHSVCARMLREAGGRGPEAALPAAAAIEPLVSDIRVPSQIDPVLEVLVKNRSAVTFREGHFPFALSYHLLSGEGRVLQWDNRHVRFAKPLPPGESRVVRLRVAVPQDPGRYQLAIDVVWESVSWLHPGGGALVRMTVE